MNNKFTVSDDFDVNLLFSDVAERLRSDLGYSLEEAIRYSQLYYRLFTDDNYCKEIGIPVQDDDFFFHESAAGVALRVHYYLRLENDPNPVSFVNWRAALNV